MPKETEKAGLKVDFSKAIKDALFLLCSSLSWYGCFLGVASWWWGWNKGWIFYFSSWEQYVEKLVAKVVEPVKKHDFTVTEVMIFPLSWDLELRRMI